MRRWSALAALAVALGACGDETGGASTIDDAGADSLAPTDAALVDAATDASDASLRDAAAQDAAVPLDPCTGKVAACPKLPNGFTEGAGLAAIDRCAFPMSLGPATNPALLAALEKLTTKVSFATALASANRTAKKVTSVAGAPAGLAYAFAWDSTDATSTTWIPQGITGTADADPSGTVTGKRAVLVSFYEDANLGKGVRIALVDVTDPANPTYRFALLVEPSGSVASPSYKSVNVHAGGIAWVGDVLYVADTSNGIRMFDMTRILEVAVDQDVVGCSAGTCRAGLYRYVIPQIGSLRESSACSPLFSFLSFDRSSSPPSLVTGEYCSTSACASPLDGKVFRWPLDGSTLGWQAAAPKVWPSEAFYMSHRQVQGAASHKGVVYLSSSAPPNSGGELDRVRSGKSATSTFAHSPEDLMVDPVNGWLWGLSEAAGERAVFAVKLASYPSP